MHERQAMADMGRSVAQEARAAGNVEEAERWEMWSELIEHGRSIEANTLQDLRALIRMQKWIDTEINDNVTSLRRIGTSWSRIGLAVGLSDEGARKKFRSLAGVKPIDVDL